MNHQCEAVTVAADPDAEDMREQIFEWVEAADAAVLHELYTLVKQVRDARPDSFDAARKKLPSAADTIERGLRDYKAGRVLSVEESPRVLDELDPR